MAGNHYSLMRGGLTHRWLARAGLIGPGTRSAAWLCALLVALTFAPLAMHCVLDDTLWRRDGSVSLLGDYATLSRLLLALPALVLLAPRGDDIMRQAMRQFVHAGLVAPSRQGLLTAELRRIRRLRDAALPELICLALALASVANYGPALGDRLPGLAQWSLRSDGRLTEAGLWLHYVSLPLFRFVLLVWLWRLLLWTILLWNLARLRLDLHPAHPDGVAGLGFVGMAQERFAVLGLANGLVLSGVLANDMLYLGTALSSLRHLIAGYLVGASLLLLAPPLLLGPTLLRVKRHALLRYGTLGNRAARDFDQRWLHGPRSADHGELLDAPDSSALADFGSVYTAIKGIPPLPLSRWNVLYVVLYAAAPLAPLPLLAFSVDELARRLFQLLA